MKITLSPLAGSYTTQVTIDGLNLTIDGQVIDLSVIPVGGEAEADEDSPLQGKVTREQVTIKYHYDMVLAEENQPTDWDDYTFDIESGDVPCPIRWRPVKVEEVIEEVVEEVIEEVVEEVIEEVVEEVIEEVIENV